MSGSHQWRTARALASEARPFLRWAGGKQRWLTSNSQFLPKFEGDYYEPFLGGGSVFFHLVRREQRPFRAWLGDKNLQLLRTYREIRDNPDEVSGRVNELRVSFHSSNDKRRFYEDVRTNFNSKLPRSNASEFIFLNATCWNGLWRTNRSGKFNVPYGLPRETDIMPTDTDLLSVAASLQPANLRACPWQNLVASASSGDFVFLDPPYFSDTFQRNSSKYGSDVWNYDRHRELALHLVSLNERGVLYTLTNSAEPEMCELYASLGLPMTTVQVPRAINSKMDARQAVGELIVSNSPTFTSNTEKFGQLIDFPRVDL